MPDYKTGRQRTLTAECAFAAPLQDNIEYPGSPGVITNPTIKTADLSMGFCGCSVRAQNYGLETPVGLSRVDWEYGATYTATNPFASPTTSIQNDVQASGSVYVPPGTPETAQPTATISKTGTISVDVEEWVSFGTITVSSDGKFTVPCTLYERARVGGVIVATIGTASVSATITAGNRVSIDAAIGYTASLNGRYTAANGSGTATMTPTVGAGAVSSPAAGASTYSGVNWSVTLTCTTLATIFCTSSNDPAAVGKIIANLTPPRSAAYSGVIRSFASAYPGTVAAIVLGDPAVPSGRIISAGSTWSASFDQKKFFWEFYAGVVTESFRATGTLDEWASTSCKLQAAALLTAGEDGNQDEAYIRGYRWTVGSFSQSSSLQLAGTFTRTNNTAYVLPDGSTAAGSKGSHVDFWGANKASGDGFRYLSIPLKHDNGANQILSSIQIGAKVWSKDRLGAAISVPTGATYTEIILDLCNPNGAETTDTQDSRYPLNRADTWGWGVTDAENIILNGIGGGVTFTVEKAELKRLGTTLLTVYPAYSNPIDRDTLSANPTGNRNDFLRCITDGKDSLQETDIQRSPSAPYGWSGLSIASIRDRVMDGQYPSNAFSMTANAVPAGCPDASGEYVLGCYLTEEREGWTLWGSGAYWSGTAWVYVIDADASSAYSVIGQVLISSIVSWFPGAGDAFELGAFGGALALRPASFLRGRAVGLTLGVNNDSVASANVTITAGTYGSGTSDSRGIYRTGTPFVPQSTRTVQSEVGATPYPEVDIGFRRKSHRAVFRVASTSEFRAIECDSARSWLYIGVANKLRAYYATDLSLQFESEAYTDVDYWVRLRYDTRNDRLWLIGKQGASTFRLCSTVNFGRTITETSNVTARTSVCECLSAQSAVVWLSENSATVKLRLSTDGGDNFAAEVDCTLSGVALTGELLDLTHDPRQSNWLFLTIKTAADTKILRSRDMGKMWEIVAS